MHERYDCGPGCPVAACLDVIGGKWRGSVLFLLLDGPVRFNPLRRLLGEPPARVLSDQLKALEAAGLVDRRVVVGTPPEVHYGLTPKGKALETALRALADWGLTRMMEEGAALPNDRATRQRAAELALAAPVRPGKTG
ncbi:MAG: helix-turn-helix domain-containing protein [Pseudomonadota bacterium]